MPPQKPSCMRCWNRPICKAFDVLSDMPKLLKPFDQGAFHSGDTRSISIETDPIICGYFVDLDWKREQELLRTQKTCSECLGTGRNLPPKFKDEKINSMRKEESQ